jgi:hypothetical protein
MIKDQSIKAISLRDQVGNRISFSLFGEMSQYVLGLFHNLSICQKIYPNWIPRVYIDKIDHRCNFYEEYGVEIIVVKDRVPPTLWRMYAMDDDRCHHIIFRDADSLLSMREKIAVDEWIASKRMFHRMKESIHFGHYPILAGMWGVNAKQWKEKYGSITKKIRSHDWSGYDIFSDNQQTLNQFRQHADEQFLSEVIWGMAKNDIYSSGSPDKFSSEAFPFKVKFEVKNKYAIEECDFVGSRIYNYKWDSV